MTPFGNFLAKQRAKLGLSLRAVAQGEFSPETIRNYENGESLPSQDHLSKIAACYRLHDDELRKLEMVYRSSSSRAISGPLGEEPFLALLDTVQKDDHLVIVAQRSLIAGQPELAPNAIELIQKGAHITNVFYSAQSRSAKDANTYWAHNHDYAAQLLNTLQARQKKASGNLTYLTIGKPDQTDFAFLRAFGASVYLCRTEDSEYLTSQVWSEIRSPGGKHYWQPCDEGFRIPLHAWLQNCGLQIPGGQFNARTVVGSTARQIRNKTLEEFTQGD